MNLETAPAIRTRRKARQSELDEARAIERAAWLWRGVPFPIPVVSHGKYLGVVCGDRVTEEPTFVDALHAMPISSTYDGHVERNWGRKQHRFTWSVRFGNGVLGNWYSLWPCLGDPGPGLYTGTARAAVSYTRASPGAMRLGKAVTPSLRYARRCTEFPSVDAAHGYVVVDRAIAYNACTMSASLQSTNNTVTATRNISAGERGYQIFGVADTVHNATAASMSAMIYTNQAGTGSRNVDTTVTLTKIVSLAAPTNTNGARNLFQTPGAATRGPATPWISLQAGDRGVRQIDSYTFSAAPTGTCCFELDFPIYLSPDGYRGGAATDYEMISGIEALYGARLYDDACLTVIGFGTTATDKIIHGAIAVGWT
jgi:hypothetical protein